jgi:hypothetical protein
MVGVVRFRLISSTYVAASSLHTLPLVVIALAPCRLHGAEAGVGGGNIDHSHPWCSRSPGGAG